MWITSNLMVTLSFPAYFSNKSDTAINAPITTGTTVTFFSFHNFPISSRRNWPFSIFSSSLSLTRASPGIVMSMILASFHLLINEDDFRPSIVASTILSHCTLKSHRTLKPVFFTTLPVPVQLSHTVANAHISPHCHVASCKSRWANLLYSLVTR